MIKTDFSSSFYYRSRSMRILSVHVPSAPRSYSTLLRIYWNECDLINRIVPDRPLGFERTFSAIRILVSSQRK
jgi:hypothetical protein